MKKIIFVLILLAIFGGVFFYIKKDSGGRFSSSKEEIVTKKAGEFDIKGSGDFTVEDIKLLKENNQFNKKTTIGIPDLDREIKVYSPDISEDAQKIAISKIKEAVSFLKKDNKSEDYWLELGRLRNMIGDYEGAKEVWEYISAVSPKSSTSFNNLGELYAYYLKDNAKAEKNYAKAIENDPSAIYIYRNFFDFYRFVAKDPTKARALLEKGIAANPSSSGDLKNLLQNIK